jgi:glycosyltransferase involved in cell wall biosynthesis
MIVKNESHIIYNTLKNICEKIPITYWVISDTGSKDNTKKIIKSFFKEKKIPGKMINHKWKDFAYNRTKVLARAYNKTDYLFVFDADDSIVGDIILPPLTHDKYMMTFGNDVLYERFLLIFSKIIKK